MRATSDWATHIVCPSYQRFNGKQSTQVIRVFIGERQPIKGNVSDRRRFANNGAALDVNVVAEVAIFADHCAAHNVNERPNSRTGTNRF